MLKLDRKMFASELLSCSPLHSLCLFCLYINTPYFWVYNIWLSCLWFIFFLNKQKYRKYYYWKYNNVINLHFIFRNVACNLVFWGFKTCKWNDLIYDPFWVLWFHICNPWSEKAASSKEVLGNVVSQFPVCCFTLNWMWINLRMHETILQPWCPFLHVSRILNECH